MEELTELIQKLWRDGLLPKRAYAELLSFTNTHESLQLLQPDVSGCFSIDDKKPKQGQEIMYKGNLGFYEGTYRNFDKSTGWVILPNGGFDCFDEWRLK